MNGFSISLRLVSNQESIEFFLIIDNGSWKKRNA